MKATPPIIFKRLKIDKNRNVSDLYEKSQK